MRLQLLLLPACATALLCSQCDNDYQCGYCLMEVTGSCPLTSSDASWFNVDTRRCGGSEQLIGDYCESDGE